MLVAAAAVVNVNVAVPVPGVVALLNLSSVSRFLTSRSARTAARAKAVREYEPCPGRKEAGNGDGPFRRVEYLSRNLDDFREPRLPERLPLRLFIPALNRPLA